MGAFSTVYITESKARETAVRWANTCSKEELETIMDAVLETRLYHCRVVPDDYENDDNILIY